MAGLGTLASTSIITKGLGNASIYPGFITQYFSLYIGPVIPPSPEKDTGGGPYPGAAWNHVPNINQFYKPTDTQFTPNNYVDPFLVPQNGEFGKNLVITLRVKLGDISVEKIYSVPENRKKITLHIFNIVDVTRKKIAVAIHGLKSIITKGKISIRNLKIRKPNDK